MTERPTRIRLEERRGDVAKSAFNGRTQVAIPRHTNIPQATVSRDEAGIVVFRSAKARTFAERKATLRGFCGESLVSDFEEVRLGSIAEPCRGRRCNIVTTLRGMPITLLRHRCPKRPFMCNIRFCDENVRMPMWSNKLLPFFASRSSRRRGMRMLTIVRRKCCPYRGMQCSHRSLGRAVIF